MDNVQFVELFNNCVAWLQSSVTVCVPYDGVVHQLMYEIDDVATRGKPLVMIEIEGEDTEDTCKTFNSNLKKNHNFFFPLKKNSKLGTKLITDHVTRGCSKLRPPGASGNKPRPQCWRQ